MEGEGKGREGRQGQSSLGETLSGQSGRSLVWGQLQSGATSKRQALSQLGWPLQHMKKSLNAYVPQVRLGLNSVAAKYSSNTKEQRRSIGKVQ